MSNENNKPPELRWSSRWGRLKISGQMRAVAQQDLQGKLARGLMAMFGRMIIMRANDAVYGDEIVYWALSPHFDEVPEGEPIPWYTCEWKTNDDDEIIDTKFVKDDHPPPGWTGR